MSEKLIIKNFGPIKDVTLDLRKVNVFIGDQGTGKSTVAKVYLATQVFIFRELFDFEYNPKLKVAKEVQIFWKYLEIFELEGYLNNNSIIEYRNSYLEFKIDGNSFSSIDKKNYSFSEKALWNFTYIPADRIMVNNLAYALNALLLSNIPVALPKLYLRFANLIDTIKKRNNNRIYEFNHMLGVDYIVKDDKEYIILSNGNLVDFKLGSSGIHSTVPLLLVYDKETAEINGNEKFNLIQESLASIVVEEPELNLFPTTQNKLLNQLIADIQTKYDNNSKIFKKNILITTHSPYILTSLNNLMYAYEVGQLNKSATNKIIEEKYWVNPKDVACFMLNDGKAKSIISRRKEGGMIKAELIDGVSKELNKDFDKLMAIELKYKKK